MPLSQFASSEEPPNQFLNRYIELGLIEDHVGSLQLNPRHFAAFEVLGLGGVGKTSLLRELFGRAREVGQVRHVLWVSLEAEASTMAIGPLRVLRNQVDIECLLFDTALVTYLDAMGQFHVDGGSRLGQSLVFKSIEVGGTLASFPLPVTFAANLYRSLSREVRKRHRYDQKEFEAIDALRLEPTALRERLPHYLARDIARGLDFTDDSLAVFYDSYEKQSPSTVSGKALWLREFIGTLERGVHVISTRASLGWPGDWDPIVQRVPVEKLSEAISRELLRARLGGLSRETEARLLAASRRIPLLLKATIDAYAIRASDDGQLDIDDLPTSPESTLTRLLDHFTGERRRVAIALSTVQVFDSGLYDYLMTSLRLTISNDDVAEVAASLFIENLPSGLRKTHDLLTDAARASAADRGSRASALNAANRYLLLRCASGGLKTPDTVLPLFRAVLTGWCSIDTMTPQSAETFVDAAYLLYDAGYWQELASMTPVVGTEREHPVAVIGDFFAALATRRTVGVDSAIELFQRFRPRVSALGRHQQSVEVEFAYLSELAGDYATARSEFRALSGKATPFDPSDRTHLRSRLYHADMLIMDGQFREGSRLLLETYEAVGHRAPLDWAELVRYRGRAFYCSFVLEEAVAFFEQARQAAAEAPALLAKLQTNIAEAYCWYDPERALDAAALAVDANIRLGSKIELAKCDAAKGIALARTGEFAAAEEVITRAAARAREAGYPAGVAFALQAKAVTKALAGDPDGFRGAFADLSRAVQSLDTYGHLRVAPAWIARDDALFVEVAVDVDWLEPERFEDRLRSYLMP